MVKMELNKIYNEDCLIGMQRIPDKSVDMILCDLPYGTTKCKWDVVIPFDLLWSQYLRAIKDNGAIVMTGQQPFTTDIINSQRDIFRYEIIWQKSQKLGFLNANKMPLRAHENILLFYKNLPVYNPQKTQAEGVQMGRSRQQKGNRYEGYGSDLGGIYVENGLRFPTSVLPISNWNGALFGNTEKATKHPTQKPVPLFEWLIKTYTHEGMTVLDNCIGSGTTAIACINTARNYIGFESNEEYFEYAEKRVKEELKKMMHTVK